MKIIMQYYSVPYLEVKKNGEKFNIQGELETIKRRASKKKN
jgi:hypothetical protein